MPLETTAIAPADVSPHATWEAIASRAWSSMSWKITHFRPPVRTYSVPSIGPNRMSYFLNVHGPSEPVETACSSSLVAIAKGVTALQQLAKAIKDQQDIQIMVEGHTDNVPIGKKSQYMQDNWDLSVMRATSITKILTKAGVSPNQVTASGKGEYSPLVINTSDANKQKNRRTEIIITPNLDELFKILNSN